MYGFDSVPSSLINDTPDPSSAKTTRLGAAPCNLDQSVGADGKATQAMVINASANATEPMRVLKMLRSHKAAKMDARPITIFRVTAVPNSFSKVKPVREAPAIQPRMLATCSAPTRLPIVRMSC